MKWVAKSVMNYKKIIFSCYLLIKIFVVVCFAQEDKKEKFIVSRQADQTKNMSRNRLKENIGKTAKEALHNCAKLNEQIGEIQIHLSKIQKNLFDKIEKLIDNKQPFKKASRDELADSYNIIKGVNLEFDNQVRVVRNLQNKISKNKCLKDI